MSCALCVGEYHALQHVDNLRYVGHPDAVGIFMEDIQRESCHHGVAHGVLLVEVAAYCPGLLVPPCAPLVDHECDALLRVFPVHYVTVALYDTLYLQALAECQVVLLRAEGCGRAFRAAPSLHGIVVEGESVHAVPDTVHEHLCPVIVIVAGTAGNLEELVVVIVTAVSGVSAVEVRVVFRAHVSATSPALVAHADVFEVP